MNQTNIFDKSGVWPVNVKSASVEDYAATNGYNHYHDAATDNISK